MFLPVFVCLSVCLSVLTDRQTDRQKARLLKNVCMDLDEMLCVDRCCDIDKLINF